MLKLLHCRSGLFAAVMLLAACQPQATSHTTSHTGGSTTTVVPTPLMSSSEYKTSAFSSRDYHAGAGDVLKITIYDEPDLSGEFSIGPDGKIALPLAGAVTVAGQTLAQLPQTIADAYRDGYLVDPKVSVELKGSR